MDSTNGDGTEDGLALLFGAPAAPVDDAVAPEPAASPAAAPISAPVAGERELTRRERRAREEAEARRAPGSSPGIPDAPVAPTVPSVAAPPATPLTPSTPPPSAYAPPPSAFAPRPPAGPATAPPAVNPEWPAPTARSAAPSAPLPEPWPMPPPSESMPVAAPVPVTPPVAAPVPVTPPVAAPVPVTPPVAAPPDVAPRADAPATPEPPLLASYFAPAPTIPPETRRAEPPVSAPLVSAPPVSAPPVSAPPVSAPPVSAPPVSAPPVAGAGSPQDGRAERAAPDPALARPGLPLLPSSAPPPPSVEEIEASTVRERLGLILAFLLPPIGVVVTIGNAVASRRRRGWVTGLVRGSVAVGLIFTLLAAVGGAVLWEQRAQALRYDELRRASTAFCAAVAAQPDLIAAPTFGWPAAAGSIPESIAAIQGYAARWAVLVDDVPAEIRGDVLTLAGTASRIAAVVAVARTVDDVQNQAVIGSLATRSALPGWHAEYCVTG